MSRLGNPVDGHWGIRFNPLLGASPELHAEILRRYPFTIGDVIRNKASGRTGTVEHVNSYGDVFVQIRGRFRWHGEDWHSEDCELVDIYAKERKRISELLKERVAW